MIFKRRGKALLSLTVCLLSAALLYLLQNQITWISGLVIVLGIAASIAQLLGFSARDLFERLSGESKGPQITMRRKYREGPIEEEVVKFLGIEAIKQYENGMSKQLPDQFKPVADEIIEAVKEIQNGRFDAAEAKAAEAIKLLESSRVLEPVLLRSQAYLIRGDANLHKERFSDAEKFYDTCRSLADLIGNNFLKIASAHGIAVVKGMKGNHIEALGIFQDIIDHHPDYTSALHNKGVALLKIAGIEILQGKYGRATGRLNQAEETFTRLGDQSGIAATLHQMANIHYLKGEYDEAERLYKQSLEIEERLGDQSGIAATLGQLGKLSEKMGHEKMAYIYYERAFEIFHRLGIKVYEELALKDLNRVKQKIKRLN